MISIISIDPSFGNCVGLYKALSLVDEVSTVFKQKDPKGFHKELPCVYGFDKIMESDHYFVVGAGAYVRLKLPKRKTTVILTDSYYLNNHKNIDLSGVRILCMPGLAKYGRYNKLYYMPFEYNEGIVKNNEFTIAHSPYSDIKKRQKGTEIITDVCNGYDLDIIADETWEDSIIRKSKAHIFIDQITERENGYIGELSKSGIEGMAVGCYTITSGIPVDGVIPAPPVVWADRNTLRRAIEGYDSDIADSQKQWVDTYLNYEFQSKYLL